MILGVLIIFVRKRLDWSREVQNREITEKWRVLSLRA